MFFKIYKRGQGKYTRLTSAFVVAIITGLGCWQLYKKIDAASLGLSREATLWVTTLVPACLFVILALLLFWLTNKPSVADFMIASESEMKKVSWSSKQEIAVSTIIVIFVVIMMAILLGVTDISFRTFFNWLLG